MALETNSIILTFIAMVIAIILLTPSYLEIMTRSGIPLGVFRFYNYLFLPFIIEIGIVVFYLLKCIGTTEKIIVAVSFFLLCVNSVVIFLYYQYRRRLSQVE